MITDEIGEIEATEEVGVINQLVDINCRGQKIFSDLFFYVCSLLGSCFNKVDYALDYFRNVLVTLLNMIIKALSILL